MRLQKATVFGSPMGEFGRNPSFPEEFSGDGYQAIYMNSLVASGCWRTETGPFSGGQITPENGPFRPNEINSFPLYLGDVA